MLQEVLIQHLYTDPRGGPPTRQSNLLVFPSDRLLNLLQSYRTPPPFSRYDSTKSSTFLPKTPRMFRLTSSQLLTSYVMPYKQMKNDDRSSKNRTSWRLCKDAEDASVATGNTLSNLPLTYLVIA